MHSFSEASLVRDDDNKEDPPQYPSGENPAAFTAHDFRGVGPNVEALINHDAQLQKYCGYPEKKALNGKRIARMHPIDTK